PVCEPRRRENFWILPGGVDRPPAHHADAGIFAPDPQRGAETLRGYGPKAHLLRWRGAAWAPQKRPGDPRGNLVRRTAQRRTAFVHRDRPRHRRTQGHRANSTPDTARFGGLRTTLPS